MSIGRGVDVDDFGVGVGAPGQVVGMVLHGGGEEDVPLWGEREAAGEFVDGFGGVFYKDAGVGLGIGSHKLERDLA